MNSKQKQATLIKEYVDSIVERTQSKLDLLLKLASDNDDLSIITEIGGEKVKVPHKKLKKLCEEDIKAIKNIPKEIRNITKEFNKSNKGNSGSNPSGGFRRPFIYKENIREFFYDCFFMTEDILKYIPEEEVNEIKDRMPLFFSGISNSNILSQLFYAYRKAVDGVIDTREKQSSYIFTKYGIRKYFEEEINEIIANKDFPDFDPERFGMQRINSVFFKATIKDPDYFKSVLGEDKTDEEIAKEIEEGLRDELEYATTIRVRIKDYHDKLDKKKKEEEKLNKEKHKKEKKSQLSAKTTRASPKTSSVRKPVSKTTKRVIEEPEEEPQEEEVYEELEEEEEVIDEEPQDEESEEEEPEEEEVIEDEPEDEPEEEPEEEPEVKPARAPMVRRVIKRSVRR